MKIIKGDVDIYIKKTKEIRISKLRYQNIKHSKQWI